jgi:hypothetical protein
MDNPNLVEIFLSGVNLPKANTFAALYFKHTICSSYDLIGTTVFFSFSYLLSFFSLLVLPTRKSSKIIQIPNGITNFC